jgi:peptidoglycan/LPS O-acetylase OafA/YrhL
MFFLCSFLFISAQTKQLTPFYQEHWWQFFIFIQNWVFIFDNPQSALHLNHLWSIAIEEQFYMIFPFLVFIIRKRRSLIILGFAILALSLSSRCIYYFWSLPSNEIAKVNCNTFFRLDTLMIGLLLYLLFQSNYISSKSNNIIRSIAWSAIIILISGIIFYGSTKISSPFLLTLGFTLIAMMYGFLTYSTILKRNALLNNITSNLFLRVTGKISYGMYIIHWPIFLAGFSILHKLNINIGESGILLLNAAICIPVTYGLSYISFKYFESYFLSKKVKMQLPVNTN